MAFPDYFSRIPPITLYDPLAELLGAAEGGLIEYCFADAVKLAGHACPTVAGAWLAGCGGLQALYDDAMPERGKIRVDFGEALESGVAGVIGSVLGLLTGAAGSGGFAGLGGRHRRRGLLHFGVAGVGHLRLTRLDNGRQVDCRVDLSAVPAHPLTGELLGSILTGQADAAQRQLFARLWQARVEQILLDTTLRPRLLTLSRSG